MARVKMFTKDDIGKEVVVFDENGKAMFSEIIENIEIGGLPNTIFEYIVLKDHGILYSADDGCEIDYMERQKHLDGFKIKNMTDEFKSELEEKQKAL